MRAGNVAPGTLPPAGLCLPVTPGTRYGLRLCRICLRLLHLISASERDSNPPALEGTKPCANRVSPCANAD